MEDPTIVALGTASVYSGWLPTTLSGEVKQPWVTAVFAFSQTMSLLEVEATGPLRARYLGNGFISLCPPEVGLV